MRLLISFVCLAMVSCQASKPLTPQQAFISLKKAYCAGDMHSVSQMLSEKSIRTIQTIIQSFKAMNASQLKSVAAHYNTTPQHLTTLTVEQFLVLQQKNMAQTSNVITQALQQPIANVTINNGKAIITVYNGMSLVFVKQGAYWYFLYE